MESASSGREVSTGTTPPKRSKEYFSNTNREIDHEHLADLLRKSADMVERGEFGSVLYEALQDFRVYYKQKYPKAPKTPKKKKKHSTGLSTRADQSIPVTTSPSNEKTETASSVILDDLKTSEEKDLEGSIDKAAKTNDEKDTKLEPDGETYNDTRDQSERTSDLETSGDSTSKTAADNPDVSTNENLDASVRSNLDASERSVTFGNIDETTPPLPSEGSIQAPDADVSVAPPTSLSDASKTIAPVETAVPMPALDATPDDSNTGTLNGIRSPFRTSSSNKEKPRFGTKFKIGAKLQKGAMNVKKAAKNVGEKISENIHIEKHHNKAGNNARDELDFYSETGVAMAVSSGRRTHVSAGGGQESSVGKSRVTHGTAGARIPAAGSRASEHEQNSVESNQSSQDNHGRHVSDRNLIHQTVVSDRFKQQQQQKPTVPNQTGQSNFESPRFANYNSYPGEASENGEANNSVKERIPIVSESSFEEADPVMECDAKPKFQRPDNANSGLVVSGWIEQYRASKMRRVWKPVLASLVEGRKPGEVTTLWIQREMTNPATGAKELEVLHRIPLPVLEEASFSEQTTDYQFRLTLYNSQEAFVFRCDESPNDALRWVQIIKQYEKLAKKSMDSSQQSMDISTKGMAVRDLRAICHGAGINTSGMERSQLEAAAEDVKRKGTFFDQRGAHAGSTTPYASVDDSKQHLHTNPDPGHSRNPPPSATPQQGDQQRIGIKELRAICHGADINTVGMERRELEAAAKEVQSRGTYFNSSIDDGARAELIRQQQQQQQQKENEDLRKRREVLERHRQEVEVARQRAIFVEEEARRKAEEVRRRAAEEEARRRGIEEAQRREEARRRAAAEEQLRLQRVAQEEYARKQAVWQHQQQAEEQRRRIAEQKAAEARRHHEEQQKWAKQTPGAHPPQPGPPQYQQQPRYHNNHQQQWQQHQQQQQQQQQHNQQRPHQPPPQPQPQTRGQSGTDDKYAKMANQSNNGGQAAITKLKHSILIQWALQPPQLQMLRPIAALVTTIHNVFPPALGVPAHDYFKKWVPITREDVAGVNGLPEESKLKKMVKRKICFFLHPDKLPRDLNEEQKFVVKMLWDITNDAWEEYQKSKEALDWVI